MRDGKADALVSAGNTGAVMTVARFCFGTLPSVDRPALAAAFPNMKEKVSVILDVGANVDSKPAHLEQFAVMGEIYYRAIWGAKRPRVALLSIGEEEIKGNELTREAASAAEADVAEFYRQRRGPRRFSRQRGRDRLRRLHRQHGAEDQRRAGGAHRRNAEESDQEQPDVASSATCFRKRAFDEFRKRTDYSEYGGAPLLGVRGITIIGHGRSNANAIKNAIRVAAELCRSRVNEKIEQELSARRGSRRRS